MKTIVDRRGGAGYSCAVFATAKTGVDSPIAIGAAAPPCDTGAFFAPAVFNGGRCWEAEKPAGSYARPVNPTSPATLCLTAVVADSSRIGVSL